MINVTISKPEYAIDHKNIKRLLVCIVLLSAANNYKGVLQTVRTKLCYETYAVHM